MKLSTQEYQATQGASALSVSLNLTVEENSPVVKLVKNPLQEQEDLWQEITDEMAKGALPAWRMWR